MSALAHYHTSFPRVTYPTETHAETHAARQYVLAAPPSTGTFNLAVYNLSSVTTSPSSLAPTDPLCLATTLSILSKEHIKFPKAADEYSSTSATPANTISVLSYHAAIDNQLPILIEDTKDKTNHKVVRKIHASAVINAINSSNLSLEDSLIFNLINTQLLDFYTLSLLHLSNDDLLKHYSIYNYNFGNEPLLPLEKFISSNLKFNLLKRNDFHVRNPNIVNYLTSYVFPKSLRLAHLSEAEAITANAKTLFSEFNEFLKTSKYWSSNDSPSIIDFQIASFVYAIHYFSPQIPSFEEIIAENSTLVSHSESIISSFI